MCRCQCFCESYRSSHYERYVGYASLHFEFGSWRFFCLFLSVPLSSSLILLGFWQFYSQVDGQSYPIQTLKTHRSALNRWMLHHKYGERTVNTVVRLSENYFLGSHQNFTRVFCSSLFSYPILLHLAQWIGQNEIADCKKEMRLVRCARPEAISIV